MKLNWGMALAAGIAMTLGVQSFAVEDVQVIAVAAANDGSATAEAWRKADGARVAQSNRQAKSDLPNPAIEAGAAFTERPERAFPAKWVIQVKAMPELDQATSKSSYQVLNAEMKTTAYTAFFAKKAAVRLRFVVLQGFDVSDWIAVGAEESGEEAADDVVQQTVLWKTMLSKMQNPITAEQSAAADKLAKEDTLPELIDAWKKAEAAPADLKCAGEFVRLVAQSYEKFMHIQSQRSTALMNIFTPDQQKLLGSGSGVTMTSSSSGSAQSSGPGSFSVSMVSSPLLTSMTVVIAGKTLGDSFDSLVDSLNTSFHTTLTAPKIGDSALRAKLVTVKLTLTSTDGALEKLANAAGAKIVKDGETLNVVAAEK